MRAVVYTRLGPPEVLQLQEVAPPVPKDHQVLVKVLAASANALDYRRFEGLLHGENMSLLSRFMEGRVIKAVGKVLGADIAGRVEAVGASVTRFKPGDAVFGTAAGSVGGFAEYACASEKTLALKPANITFESAAAVPVAALTALQALRDHAQIKPGAKVLINGASGGVGTFAVQLAKAFGAEVTAVCSARHLDMLPSIGADHVLDYTQTDFTTSGQRYDLIIAVNGYHTLLAYRRALHPGGRCVVVGGAIPQVLQAMLLGPLLSRLGSQKIGFMGIASPNHEDLVLLGTLLQDGNIVPVIDRHYPLNAAAEAVRYLAAGHARGKVVFHVAPDASQPGARP
ncbi:MAG: NAD(P)-dependent alcohol dehydrogenase [Chloroflexi bacterium]|nr:NAD(P)-dependent alcohol dehydrogenase [Chloroflexota bacterium]